jgi:hypothetical protein
VPPSNVISAAPSRFTAPEDKDAVERVVTCGEAFLNGIGREFKDRCERFFRQYRSFSQLQSAWIQAEPPDRDALLYDAKRQWGANLHIPLSFRTIETVVPAAIAQRPRMLYLPRRERWAENVANVRVLIDAQQEQIDIDLPFQAVMRAGRIYGLGVGKVLWRKEYALRQRVKPRLFGGVLNSLGFEPSYTLGRAASECVFDDPDFEDVDPFDFMWDPYGSDMRTVGWVIHRTWRSLDYCLQMLRSGTWKTASTAALMADGREEEHLRTLGSGQKYDDVWQARMEASGFSTANFQSRGEQIHEVWEWHDGNRVWTVLDRQILVVADLNPCVGTIPFMVYRPTPLQKQMVGIGDLEPLEHLQRELDTLRSQQRDAATMALAPGWAYDSMAVDEEDLEFAPNMAIEVRNARPSDAIMPLPKPEIPASTFRDQEIIRADIEAVSGINEALNPSGGPNSSTATEAQLAQAALSRRVELGSRRFEIEVVRRAARCFLHLNQRMILKPREPLRQPDEGLDLEQAAREGRWRWFPIGPGELQGEFEIVPEGGSMAARNVPQDRQDAQVFLGLAAQNPHIDGRRATLKGLELLGVSDPVAWLASQEPAVGAGVFQALAKMGVDGRLIQRAIEIEQRRDPRLPDPERGPDVQQMDQAMGVPQEASA